VVLAHVRMESGFMSARPTDLGQADGRGRSMTRITVMRTTFPALSSGRHLVLQVADADYGRLVGTAGPTDNGVRPQREPCRVGQPIVPGMTI
jgi:hypothetical protein